ncbi:MAG: TRAP transporter small permease [Pseudomonadota bacterium]
MYQKLSQGADVLARCLALAGGALLIAITALTVISIIGRAFVPLQIGIGPIRGIYDYTQIAIAAAVFAFLPLCQLRQAHAVVDLFETRMPASLNRFLDLLFNAVMLLAASVGTYRLYLGMRDKMRTGEVTQIAEVPAWWGYALGLVGAVAFVLVAAFCVLRAARVVLGRTA